MGNIQQHTDFGLLLDVFKLTEQERATIAKLLDKLPHKSRTRITDINDDEIFIQTKLYDKVFTIVYARNVTNEYKWVLCTAKKVHPAITYKEVELFITMYNKYF